MFRNERSTAVTAPVNKPKVTLSQTQYSTFLESVPTSADAMSNFVPSPAELALTTQIFAISDPQKLGIITGDAAVKVFARANLPATTLGEIWAIADKDNNGFLTKKGVTVALRLLGWAQKGEPVTEALVNKREFLLSSETRLALTCSQP